VTFHNVRSFLGVPAHAGHHVAQECNGAQTHQPGFTVLCYSATTGVSTSECQQSPV